MNYEFCSGESRQPSDPQGARSAAVPELSAGDAVSEFNVAPHSLSVSSIFKVEFEHLTYPRSEAQRQQPPLSFTHQIRNRISYRGHKLLQFPIMFYVPLPHHLPHHCRHQSKRWDQECQRRQGDAELLRGK